jgi:hypothetical protein
MEVSGQPHTFPCLGKETQVSIEAGWAAEIASTHEDEKHLLPMVGFRPQFLGYPAYSCHFPGLCAVTIYLARYFLYGEEKLGLLFMLSRNTQSVPFIISLSLTPLLHRKSASASASHGSCHAQGNCKRMSLYYCSVC